MKRINGKTALITGASSGIGAAFATELAKEGATLILTARSESTLRTLAEKLTQQFNTQVHVFPADLSQPGAADALMKTITSAGLSVDLLINNAGVGKWANFLDESQASYESMLMLNITSLMNLTYQVLPGMLAKGEGGIINVASTGSFQPTPYIAVYGASKAFVLNFSEALYGEYMERGITVTALCPGNTATGFQAEANADTQGMRADTPETVARQGLAALKRGDNYQVVGTDNYLQSLLPRVLPRKTVIRIVSNMIKSRIEARQNKQTAETANFSRVQPA